MESHDSAEKLKKNIAKSAQESASFQKQAAQLDMILNNMISCVKFGTEKLNSVS